MSLFHLNHLNFYGLHTTLLINAPKGIGKNVLSFWVRRRRWSLVGDMSLQPWLLSWHLPTCCRFQFVSILPKLDGLEKRHGILMLPTHCEKIVVQYQRYVFLASITSNYLYNICFSHYTSPCFSRILQKCHGVPSSVWHLLPASLVT